jgi:hypothetical protein
MAVDTHREEGLLGRNERDGPSHISSRYEGPSYRSHRGPREKLSSQTVEYRRAGRIHRDNGPAYVGRQFDRDDGREVSRFERGAKEGEWTDEGKTKHAHAVKK